MCKVLPVAGLMFLLFSLRCGESPAEAAAFEPAPFVGRSPRLLSLGGEDAPLVDSPACAVFEDNTLECGSFGFVDDKTTEGQARTALRLIPVPGGADIQQLDVATDSACVVHHDAGLSCLTPASQLLPVSIGAPAEEVAVTNEEACVRLADGTVRCFLFSGGRDDAGFPGNPVAGLSGVREIDRGASFACAVKADDSVHCWGDNQFGQLGSSSLERSTTPVQVSGLSAKSVALGSAHACALLTDGTVKCWGRNDSQQLGNSERGQSAAPVALGGLNQITAIVASVHTSCALRSDGTVHCWGANGTASTGQQPSGGGIGVTPVPNVRGATAIRLGRGHGCATLADGTVRCWGGHPFGGEPLSGCFRG